MPSRLPPLNALRAFEAAGRHGSFTGAAEELAVAHSSISRHVRGLEARLGVRLFREEARGVALTQEGAAYLAEVTPAFEAISEATERLGAQPEGVVTMSVEPLFAIKWLMPRLSEFYEAHPGVELRMEASGQLANVARFEVDVALRYYVSGQLSDGGSLISNEVLCAVAAPSLISKPFDDPADLLDYPLLRDRRGSPWTDWFTVAGVSADLVPEMGWRMRALLSYEATLAGHGILLTSAELVEHDIAQGRLIKVYPTVIRQGAYALVESPGAGRKRAVAAFRAWLLGASKGLRSGETQPMG